MGVSTDGILVYGIDLGEEIPELLREAMGEDTDDLDDLVAELSGIKRPSSEHYNDNAWSEFWEAQREAVKKFPITIVPHCSGNCPMYLLAVNGTKKLARRGYPKVIDPADLVVTESQLNALRDFCAQYDIPFEGNHSWKLVSYWG